MGFEKDLFISYAHIDNQPLSPEQQGWITRFHMSLEAMLNMRLGGKAEIWRDDKLQGIDVFSQEIVAQFPQTAVLVSILTPRYINSEWCTREVKEFCKSAQQSGGVVVDNKARIFKVIKTPVDTEESLPDVMKSVLGYEFYTLEDETPLELDPAFGEKFAQDFNRKIGKLAFDLAQLLKKLKVDIEIPGSGPTIDNNAIDEGSDRQSQDKPIVYLAECSLDRREEREILEGDLKRHGYAVLPDQQLPREEEDYVASVKRILENCRLAIHLVGKIYGAVPDGLSQKSVVELQNEIAIGQSKTSGLKRIIWLPEGTGSEQATQQKFIEALHRNAEAQFGADLITGDLEELKTSIHGTLKQLEKPEPNPHRVEEQESISESAKLIYLICDKRDRKATVPIRKYCHKNDLKVVIPAFQGDATAVREANQKLLTNCDAVILFYGAGDEAWKRTMDNDLKKMMGYRAGKPLLASYTYLADPITSDKEDLIDMEEPNLIDGTKGFSEDLMNAFLLAINPKGATS